MLLPILALLAAQSAPRQPATPVILEASELDPCSNGVVRGLKKGGDGFLSLRSAPSAKAPELARLREGEALYVCGSRDGWLAVIRQRRAGDDCGTQPSTSAPRARTYRGPCASGWVAERWVEMIAG